VKVVVAGGTGFVGRHICRRLLEDGHDVVVLSRNPQRVQSIPELSGAESVRTDVTKPASLLGTLHGASAVVGAVQLPGYPAEVPRRGLTFDNFDRRGTEYLVQEARRAGVGRYVYISGAGADTKSERSWYRAKGFAEKAVIESGIDYTILRPSWAYGPGDRALNSLAVIARYSPIVPRIGLKVQRIQPVYIGDLALAVARALQRDEARNRTLEIGSAEIVTMHEVIRGLCARLGKRRLIVPVPATLGKLATAPLTLLPRPPMTPGGIEFVIQDGLVDTAELERLLDVHPVSLREGLSRYTPG
jgi:uncharacterized protein YbjT (DUF2867 family)